MGIVVPDHMAQSWAGEDIMIAATDRGGQRALPRMCGRRAISKAEVDKSASRLLLWLEHNHKHRLLEYPHGASWPQNCCESVSLILTYLLEEKFVLDNVRIIKGTNSRYQHHLWVMVGDWIYDLTQQQFAGGKPVIGSLYDEFLLKEFPDWDLEEARDFVDRARVVALFKAGSIDF